MDLSEEDIESFWDQDISMEQVEFVLLVPEGELKTGEFDRRWYCHDGSGEIIVTYSVSHPFLKIITDTYNSAYSGKEIKWNIAQYREKTYGVGVAYKGV